MTTAPSASDAEVSFDHQPIDVDRFDDVYVVGDVHGCFDALERLLSRSSSARMIMQSSSSPSGSARWHRDD